MRSDRRPSKLAIAFVVVGLALSAAGVAYIIYAGRPRQLPPVAEQAFSPQRRVQELEALLRMLTQSFVIFMAFLLGSYLMVRIGRALLGPQHRESRPTEYVDAWGQYRLSEEQVEAASRQLRDALGTPPEPPDESAPPPQPPGEPPDS